MRPYSTLSPFSPVGGASMRPWAIPAPGPYAFMRPWAIPAPGPYAFMRPWPRSAPGPYAFMRPWPTTTAGKARGDRKGTRRPADRPRHPWRGRFALRPGLHRPASTLARCQSPIFTHQVSAATRAALMPPLQQTTIILPVGGAFMRPWPRSAPGSNALMPPLQHTITILPVGGAFMRLWPRSAPWPFLTREFQALKSRDGARLKAGSVIKISGLNGNKLRSSAARP